VFAVQWHPEFHAPDDPSLLDDTPIFDEFLAAAAQHKAAAYTI
jgi:putative glutamine amidotransferase